MGEGGSNHLRTCIWSTFVVPRLLYGLESILLSKKDVECVSKSSKGNV